MDNIRRDMKVLNVGEDWEEIAQDRQEKRHVIQEAKALQVLISHWK